MRRRRALLEELPHVSVDDFRFVLLDPVTSALYIFQSEVLAVFTYEKEENDIRMISGQ